MVVSQIKRAVRQIFGLRYVEYCKCERSPPEADKHRNPGSENDHGITVFIFAEL